MSAVLIVLPALTALAALACALMEADKRNARLWAGTAGLFAVTAILQFAAKWL